MESKKKMSPVKKTLVALAVVLSVVVALELVVRKVVHSPVQKMAKKELASMQVVSSLMEGCIMRGMETPELAILVIMTQGQVCGQILGGSIDLELDGDGYCSQSDKSCLFKIGYAKTAIATSQSLLSSEDVAKIEEQADVALTRLKEEQGE